MAQEVTDYRPLSGRTWGLFGNSQRLYAGPDHLLLVKTAGYAETYKRFYYNDIQAIAVQKTTTAKSMNIVSGLLLPAFVAVIVLAVFFRNDATVALAVIATIGAISTAVSLVINIALGPTCECHLLTAVHQERLAPLGRLRNAQRAITSLRPLIETIQGLLPEEQTANTLSAAVLEQTMSASRAAPTQESVAQAVKRDSGNVHMALFMLLFVDCIISLVQIMYPASIPSLVGLSITFVLFALTVWAVARQHRSDMPPPLRNVVWSVFVYMCFLACVLWFFEVLRQMDMQMGGGGSSTPFAQFAQTISLVANTISVVCDLLMGTLGLIFLRTHLRAHRAAENPAPES